jgi:hypothetical protein
MLVRPELRAALTAAKKSKCIRAAGARSFFAGSTAAGRGDDAWCADGGGVVTPRGCTVRKKTVLRTVSCIRHRYGCKGFRPVKIDQPTNVFRTVGAQRCHTHGVTADAPRRSGRGRGPPDPHASALLQADNITRSEPAEPAVPRYRRQEMAILFGNRQMPKERLFIDCMPPVRDFPLGGVHFCPPIRPVDGGFLLYLRQTNEDYRID